MRTADAFTLTLTVTDDFPWSHSSTTTATISAPQPPGSPMSPTPTDGATDISTSPTLTWERHGAVNYDVRFGTVNPPPLVSATQAGHSYAAAGLAAGTNYYWQIIARNTGGSTAGPLWSFTTASDSPTVSEVVIYASDVPSGNVHGAWTTVPDPTSPDGVTLTLPDAGAATVTLPLASPDSYVDVPFDADAGTAYTLWFRLQASGNSKWNDSLWVQFSDAMVNGSPVYAMGSADGLLVNLATDGTGSSLNGWGWQNGAYWLSQAQTFTFSTPGPHVLRIQGREDGVQLDQIVLSPSSFLASAPGAATDDSTIVPKDGMPPSPQSSAPADVVIQAADIPASALHGAWTVAGDATSPEAVKVITSDVGFASTQTPLATPTHYVDVTFDAAAGTPYTIWLRLRAHGDAKSNDSLWAQFSDATVNGSPAYRLDSQEGLLINLATDGGATSLQGWGWQNGAYWLSQRSTVVFSTTGLHTLRLQVREDGVELDQIVLSPRTYLRTPPGPPSNDSTIVPK